MKSSLQIHKETLRAIEDRIILLGGEVKRGNFGKETDPVGSFAVFSAVDIPIYENRQWAGWISVQEPIPVQTMKLHKNGKLMPSGGNYRLAPYGKRLGADIDADVYEVQELQDMPDKPGYEEWVTLLRF